MAKAQVSLRTFLVQLYVQVAFDDLERYFPLNTMEHNLVLVQRTATLQLAGVVDVDVDSNTVTGTGTRFREQLKAGDRIVLKGMTHVVTQVDSNTTMYLAPDFRGVTDVRASKLCLIRDKKTEQEDFNLDRMDGTGPSGYNLDIQDADGWDTVSMVWCWFY